MACPATREIIRPLGTPSCSILGSAISPHDHFGMACEVVEGAPRWMVPSAGYRIRGRVFRDLISMVSSQETRVGWLTSSRDQRTVSKTIRADSNSRICRRAISCDPAVDHSERGPA